MALDKDQIKQWVKNLNLDNWGPTEVIWNEDFKRVSIIVGEGESESSLQQIKDAVAASLSNDGVTKDDADEFLKVLYVSDYAVED
ncbi:MAG: hypothetical protein LBM27_05505 [Lactobacillaceae bacterium]|jgi:hypothetical protein|nr:hypothetical protein [Lactobacillaceae bacterium]